MSVKHLERTLERSLHADVNAAARQARDKLAYARVWLLRHKPFFGVLARAFLLEATLAVPGYRLLPDDRLLFNPLTVLAARPPALAARLAHLALHAALGAHFRRGEREPRRWNVAHDLAIFPLLDAADLSLGTPPNLPLDLAPGASAEAIYRALAPEIAPDPMWADLSEPVDSATPRMPPTQRGGAASGDSSADRGATADTLGQVAPHDVAPHALDSFDAAARARELDWKLRLAAALEEEARSGGSTFGELPASLAALLRATIEPPASFSAILQQSIHLLQRTERSYLRPSRRMSALAAASGRWPELVMMPGRRIEHGGRLVAVVDTSASLPLGTIGRFFGAIVAAATAEGIDELRVVQADCEVTRDETSFAADLLFRDVEVSGRGGTDFAPALAMLAAEALRDRSRFTVAYLTDLEGRMPPDFDAHLLDVVWVVAKRTASLPPFGRVVELA